MDYNRIYQNLVAPKDRCLEVKETHHILPKSLGGTDDTDNLVDLTPKEHYIAHRLLVKITEGEDRQKMAFALWRMTNKGEATNAHAYEKVRKEYREALSEYRTGKKFGKHSEEAREKARLRALGENNNMYGKKHTDESRQKMSEALKGTRKGENNPFYGKTHDPETIERIRVKSSLKQKGRPKPKSACPHCGGLFAANTMARFHGEKCKLKP